MPIAQAEYAVSGQLGGWAPGQSQALGPIQVAGPHCTVALPPYNTGKLWGQASPPASIPLASIPPGSYSPLSSAPYPPPSSSPYLPPLSASYPSSSSSYPPPSSAPYPSPSLAPYLLP